MWPIVQVLVGSHCNGACSSTCNCAHMYAWAGTNVCKHVCIHPPGHASSHTWHCVHTAWILDVLPYQPYQTHPQCTTDEPCHTDLLSLHRASRQR